MTLPTVGLALELGRGPVHRDRDARIIEPEAPQRRFTVADLGDVLGVIRVIGGHMQSAARAQTVGQQRHGARLQQPPLVMAGLGPGVRENTRAAVSDPDGSRCSSTSRASPRISRIFSMPSRSIADNSWARPLR